ncbi:MAG: transcriptional regulator [Thermoleophilia bacterium]|nr:transcriptional regulator [Thermoleophilia bacterium]
MLELELLAAVLDRVIECEGGDTMETDRQIIDALGGFDPADHAEEARERWGETDAYGESARRTREYTAADWREIRAEADALTLGMARLYAEEVDPASQVAIDAAEAWRLHVTRRYYDLTPSMQRDLGEMYVADPRFTAYYDRVAGEADAGPGLAAWVRDAFAANAEAHR